MLIIAARPINSRGREHNKLDRFYTHDVDRITNSKAFARLQHKTQVFLIHEGDFYRTRLTHSLEVAQVARTIAQSLRVNRDLAEAIALAHDLGHTPFGHAGETALSQVMKNHGGFEHNEQALRVVGQLERHNCAPTGLDLMWETREGIARHYTSFDKPKEISGFDETRQPGVEAQIVNIADVIAYATHDVEDAIEARLLEPETVTNQRLWKHARNGQKMSLNHLGRRQNMLTLRQKLIDDVVENTRPKTKSSGLTDPADVRTHADPIVMFSPEVERDVKEFVATLTKQVYLSPWVARMDTNGGRILKALFEALVDNPKLLPTHTRDGIRGGDGDLNRGVCDFVSGMTDRHAIVLYKSIFDPDGRSLSLTS
jgi:dGTPase